MPLVLKAFKMASRASYLFERRAENGRLGRGWAFCALESCWQVQRQLTALFSHVEELREDVGIRAKGGLGSAFASRCEAPGCNGCRRSSWK